jgi:hypothetical protein
MLSEIGNVTPGVFLHWRVVDKDGEAVGTIWNNVIFDVKPSGIPVPDGFMRRDRRYSLWVEHEGHAAAIYHVFLLHLLLHAVEELKEPDIRTDSEVTFAQSDEVGEDEVGVGANVVRLQPVGVEDLLEGI